MIRNDSAGARVGIDLGTTNSLIACMVDGHPFVIPNALEERLTPSAISIDEAGHVLVGAPALARSLTSPEATACNFKRDMGTAREYTLAGRTLRPEALSALVLEDLRKSAERYLGVPVTEAIVTVPAYFGEQQRRATKAACEIAGLHVERVINEPTAAALAYGFGERDKEARVVVLDLGGGTFDVSVLEIIDGVVEIQASAGDSRLGGEDFVEVMMQRCADILRVDASIDLLSSPLDAAKLRDACERTKRELSRSASSRVLIANVGHERRTLTLELTREQVHGWWRDLISRMRSPVRRALADAGWAASDVDEVLLVGGATRMPIVDDFVAEVFNKPGLRSLPPDEAVALGAAVQAALKADDEQVADLVVTDVAPFSLGIETVSSFGSHNVAGLFTPILERGTVLPASRVKTFTTIADRQRRVDFGVYQGEHSLCRNNTKIGEYKVKGIPPGPAGSEAIEVRFTYDLNGLLEIETTVVGTGVKETLTIDRSTSGMSKREIDRARKEMERLKFHPREALPNVTALERADALYAKLTGDAREILGGALAAFRACMEGQDPVEISEVRQRLVSLTQQLQEHS